MLWLKSFHIIFMVTWFAGLFYLPRLFVYHAMSQDEISDARFKIMERKLFYGIATPGAVFTLLFGFLMLQENWAIYKTMGWMHAKLFLVFVLVIYHGLCGRYVAHFKRNQNKHSHVYYRWFNEAPVLILVAVVILVMVRPF